MEQHHGEELYWCLVSKGYRTYRFLPLFFNEFYPRHDADTPRAMRAVIDAVGRAKYPERYDAASGIIRATATSDRLRQELGETSEGRQRDPHIAFFHASNPGHVRGDELCCVAPLRHENFSVSARRLIQSPRFAVQPAG
jgi:hypothetical protein